MDSEDHVVAVVAMMMAVLMVESVAAVVQTAVAVAVMLGVAAAVVVVGAMAGVMLVATMVLTVVGITVRGDGAIAAAVGQLLLPQTSAMTTCIL